MSSTGGNTATSTQAIVSDSKDTSKPLQNQKPAAQLEEDDEFEDFTVEGVSPACRAHAFVLLWDWMTDCLRADWAKEEEVGAQGTNTHLWEESWDDDDTSDDFSVQLKCV